VVHLAEIFHHECTRDKFEKILREKILARLITIDEDRQLTKAKLRSRMPDDWDGASLGARYQYVQRLNTKTTGGGSK